MTTTEQRLADALRPMADCLRDGITLGIRPGTPQAIAIRDALAAYDAQQTATPGPWWFAATHGDVYAVGVGDVEKATGLTREDAARIVQCVNAHEELVSALKLIEQHTHRQGESDGMDSHWVQETARDALAAAGVRHA